MPEASFETPSNRFNISPVSPIFEQTQPTQPSAPFVEGVFTDQAIDDVVEGPPAVVADENQKNAESGADGANRLKEWFVRRKTRIAVAVAGLSLGATLLNNPISELKDDVVEVAPWVASGVAVSEAAFCVGAAMMVAAIGDKIGNPFKLKGKVQGIAEKANNSKLFKAGFWLNAAGAVGDFVVISGGVLREMPVESYPALSLTLLDLGATIAVRKAILSGIRKNVSSVDKIQQGEE